jgi:L-lactate dehydrogenase complex protein LldF
MSQPSFHDRTAAACDDPELGQKLRQATDRQTAARKTVCEELGDVERFRELGASVRNHALQNLDTLLSDFVARVEAAGVQVHWARDAEEARYHICRVARTHEVKRVIKSKSMVTEEIELTPCLEAAGLEVTETDLGEFIIQRAGQPPSHIVIPAIHLSAEDVACLFRDQIGYEGEADAAALTRAARVHLRDRFREATMGISGVNFAVAEAGAWTVCTNEGNGRYVTGLPEVYLAVMGLERIVQDAPSLAVMMKLLARFATGQRITQYVNLVQGPNDQHGPKHVHLVILDNGRSTILGSRYWPMLRCIRCGACLNICPVFHHIGGQTFPGAYSGPMGSVLLPLQLGLENAGGAEKACSLCGACQDVCPVKIPLPELLLELRHDAARGRHYGFTEKTAMQAGSWLLRSPTLYRWAQRLGRWISGPLSRAGWIRWLPGRAGRWTSKKDLPRPAPESFLARERARKRDRERHRSQEPPEVRP